MDSSISHANRAIRSNPEVFLPLVLSGLTTRNLLSAQKVVNDLIRARRVEAADTVHLGARVGEASNAGPLACGTYWTPSNWTASNWMESKSGAAFVRADEYEKVTCKSCLSTNEWKVLAGLAEERQMVSHLAVPCGSIYDSDYFINACNPYLGRTAPRADLDKVLSTNSGSGRVMLTRAKGKVTCGNCKRLKKFKDV